MVDFSCKWFYCVWKGIELNKYSFGYEQNNVYPEKIVYEGTEFKLAIVKGKYAIKLTWVHGNKMLVPSSVGFKIVDFTDEMELITDDIEEVRFALKKVADIRDAEKVYERMIEEVLDTDEYTEEVEFSYREEKVKARVIARPSNGIANDYVIAIDYVKEIQVNGRWYNINEYFTKKRRVRVKKFIEDTKYKKRGYVSPILKKADEVLVLAEARLKGEVGEVLANLREQITKQFGVETR